METEVARCGAETVVLLQELACNTQMCWKTLAFSIVGCIRVTASNVRSGREGVYAKPHFRRQSIISFGWLQIWQEEFKADQSGIVCFPACAPGQVPSGQYIMSQENLQPAFLGEAGSRLRRSIGRARSYHARLRSKEPFEDIMCT